MKSIDTKKFILALKIKELRTKQGVSLKELANKCGISISYLNEIEKAKKYPKADKLDLIASALYVTAEYLTSLETGLGLKPLVNLFNEELLNKLPLKEFGITHTDLFDVMSYSPEKFSSFIITMGQIIRTHGLTFENINQAALRAYQQTHLNYFNDIEKLCAHHTRSNLWQGRKKPDRQLLMSLLEREFNYRIEFSKQYFIDELKYLTSIYKKGNPNKLIINSYLSEQDIVFQLAKELGYCLSHQNYNRVEGANVAPTSFQELFNQFRAHYFAGSLIIQPEMILSDLRTFFAHSKFYATELQKIMESYDASPSVFFYRLAQIIPHYFGLNKLFLLFSSHNLRDDSFHIANELHLSQLHRPHATMLGEQYCRRWITVSLLNDFKKTQGNFLIGAQISTMIESDEKYLCLSIAYKDALNENKHNCITIGILINQKSKEIVQFTNDSEIVHKYVGQTCERCGIENCLERKSAPTIFANKQMQKGQADKIQEVILKL